MKLHFADGMQKIWQSDTVFAACSRVACFENEVACLQLVVVNEGLMEEVRLVVACELPVQVRRVGYVPGDFTDHPDTDDYVIAKGLHVFPDPLLPVDTRAVTLKGNCANVFYLTVGTGERMPVGTHRLGVSLQRGGETAAKGQTFIYEQYLGGKVSVNEVNDGVTAEDLHKTESGVDAAFRKEDAMLFATLPAPKNNREQQSFTLTGALLTGIGTNAEKLSVVMQATKDTAVSVYLVGSKGEVSLASVTFGETAQTVTLSLGNVNWNKVGDVQSLRFVAVSGGSAVEVGIGRVLVYGK